jgi:hypothetical protein
MRRGRRCHRNSLDGRISAHLIEGHHSPAVLGYKALGTLRIGIDHRLKAAKLGKAANQVPAPGSPTDDGNARLRF